jgi:hypothetical protein
MPSSIISPQVNSTLTVTPDGAAVRLPGETPVRPSSDTPAKFATFADETGISAVELQDVFLLGNDGEIEILPPARKLGSSVADRARTVTILMAGARHVLQRARTPVEDIRRTCADKGCYDSKNFKSKHLGHFDAINVRNDEIIVNASKWLTSFTAAMKTARGEVGE